MEFFDHRYYRLSKTFMTLLGLWPYQSTRARCGFIAVSMFICTTGWLPAILAFVKYRYERTVILECVALYTIGLVSVIKLIGIIWNSEKILILLNRICTHWRVWARHREVNILHKYAQQGGKMIIVYTDLMISFTATLYSSIIIVITEPMIPKIIDVILKNGTEPGLFPFPLDYYYFDAQQYYYYVMMHCYISSCTIALPFVASDSLLILYVQHICGVFAALRQKSKKIGHNDTSVENIVELSSFIERHNDSIEYAELIEATYTWDFFLIVGLGIIAINLLGLQVLLRTNDPESIVKYVFAGLVLVLIFYVDCYICQILIDHSVNVGFYIYNGEWYRLLPNDRKHLQLIIVRCRVPCQVTAGKMFIMSMRTFGLIMRSSMSYFVVVQSMHDKLNIA